MNILLLLKSKVIQYFLSIITAFAAFFIFKNRVRRSEQKRIARKQNDVEHKFNETALTERVSANDEINSLDDIALADRVSKYSRTRRD